MANQPIDGKSRIALQETALREQIHDPEHTLFDFY
jgi:hypothetical protein